MIYACLLLCELRITCKFCAFVSLLRKKVFSLVTHFQIPVPAIRPAS
uniref:Uncharacterized protein n=1 Tax=Arundo donax TaxID=35708 RepID=A0A0A9CB94_ARUDO